jgi:hypothetical protein
MKTENKSIAASAIALYLSLTLLFIEVVMIKNNMFRMLVNDVLLEAKGTAAITVITTIAIVGSFFFLKHSNHRLTINYLIAITVVTAIYFSVGIVPNALPNF